MDEVLHTTDGLYSQVAELIQSARKQVATQVNSALLATYWNVGRLIVEDEQKGQLRAEYGTYLLENVAQKLTAKYKRGYSADNLKLMRRFYVVYAQDTIRETLFPQLENYPRTSNGLRFFLCWSHY